MAITPPKERDTMEQFTVQIVIGTEYLYLVDAEDALHAEYIMQRYDQTPTDKFSNHVTELEHEAGRAIVKITEFHHPPCSICGEAQLDCIASSVEAGEIKNTIETLYNRNNNEEIREHLTTVLNNYLTHGVSPCNDHSRA